MSPYYFSRLFKKTTDDTIKEITYATGFGSEANFITCFKKHNGCTPRQFREMPF